MLKIIILSAIIWVADSSRILGIFPTPDINHFTLCSRLMETLARRGHQVTLVSPFRTEETIENLTLIETGKIIDFQRNDQSRFSDKIGMNFVSSTVDIYGTAYKTTEIFLSDPNFQYLLQSNQKYDVIIIEYFLNEAVLGISSYFNAPVILLSPLPSSTLMNELFANPAPSSYVPNILTGHTGTMSFGERLDNFVCNIFNKHYKYYIALPNQQKLMTKYIDSSSNIGDAIAYISLVLLNSHPSVTEPVPHTPNLIEVGGMHIVPTKPLPNYLQVFIHRAVGMIYIALNSNLRSSDLGRARVIDILNNFEQLADLNFVWKLNVDEDIGKVPKNVMIIQDNIPHEDILGENNIVAFITDGDLLRIMEAVHFKVPIIGIPLIGDQKSNIARAVEDGYGIEIPFYELTGQKLYDAIQQILTNGQYSYNVRKRSKLLGDHIVSPMETAVYWVEYVVRHGGARHLQSPGVQLPIFKRHLIDIIIVLTIIDIIVFLLLYYIIKHIIHLVKRKYKEREIRKYVQLEKDLVKS